MNPGKGVERTRSGIRRSSLSSRIPERELKDVVTFADDHIMEVRIPERELKEIIGPPPLFLLYCRIPERELKDSQRLPGSVLPDYAGIPERELKDKSSLFLSTLMEPVNPGKGVERAPLIRNTDQF